MPNIQAIKDHIIRLIAEGKVDEIEDYLNTQLPTLSNEEKQQLVDWMEQRD